MNHMTVGELRMELANFPDDTPVVLARSVDGTDCSPLHLAAEALYAPGGEYSGEFYPTPQMAALVRFDQGVAPENAVLALTLWPAS